MSFFFERDAELYVSNVTSGWGSGNTDKIPLKAGFSYNLEDVLSQTNRNTIKANESRSVSKYSARQPLVNFSFTTYINPIQLASVTSTDRYLWQGLGAFNPGASYAQVGFTSTNTVSSNYLTLWVKFSDTVYRLNNCVITVADITGRLNDLAQITWGGTASSITNLGNVSIAHTELTIDNYIINKLSTIDLSFASDTYNIPVTDYSISIRNNIIQVYRAKIGDIERVTGHYTGTRTIEGDFSAYLRIGTNRSVELFDNLRSLSDNLENNLASFTIHTGDVNDTHIDYIMPNTILEVPSQQFTGVVILRVPFSAQESTKGAADELTVRYYS